MSSWIGSCWWWKISCTTWDVENYVNNGINYLSTGAGFLPSTVQMTLTRSVWCHFLALSTIRILGVRLPFEFLEVESGMLGQKHTIYVMQVRIPLPKGNTVDETWWNRMDSIPSTWGFWKSNATFFCCFLSPNCPKSWLNNIRINDTVMRCNDGNNEGDRHIWQIYYAYRMYRI